MRSACPPPSLFRYRPLSGDLFERELSALADGYLYAPSFSEMNDPMEAFYEFDGSFDFLLNALVPGIAPFAQGQLRQTIDRFGLVSFSDASDNLLLWGYYAQGFRGMCLEFDPTVLQRLSRLKNEPLFQVSYADAPAPPLPTGAIIGPSVEDAMIRLLTRKRREWSHEREWRFLTGQVGKRHYADDALRRIYIGPLATDEHKTRICEAMKRRPVEILKGEVIGYNLSFDVIQAAPPFTECDRAGDSQVDLDSLDLDSEEIESFLRVPAARLRARCAKLAEHPNINNIGSVHLNGERLVVCAAFRLRDGLPAYDNLCFDRQMNVIAGD